MSDSGPSSEDALPAELDVTGYVGPYTFPNNSRRKISGGIYLATGVGLLVLWIAFGRGGVFVSRGFLVVGVALLAIGAYHFAAGYPSNVNETDALAAAAHEVGFAVGHASAQMGWRGLRSRPTWRILLYSADDPPTTRGLVLVDAVDGNVVAHFTEPNPEDWSSYGPAS